MASTPNTVQPLSGFPSHVQELLQQAAQHVTMTQQSQTQDSRDNPNHQSQHCQEQRQPSFRPSRGQDGGRGRRRGRGRGEGHLAPEQRGELATGPAPEVSDSQAFPPLGSAPPHTRHYHASPRPHLGPGVASPQNRTQITPSQTVQHHASMNVPGDFFQRARAGAYRGRSDQMRRPQSHHQPENQSTSPPTRQNLASNGYSRPRPRNHSLYEPPVIPDQQYLQERVQMQHHFLMATASLALQTALTPAEGQEKDAFRLELETVAQAAVADHAKTNATPIDLRKVKLKCYGSLANGFAVEGSDLDLLLMLPNEKGTTGSIEAGVQRRLEKAFLDAGYGARLLTKTRVPILRVCQKPTSELLESLRQNRKRWEEEEEEEEEEDGQPANENEDSAHGLDSKRLPEATDEQLRAASKAFAELELSPSDIPLPPSPVRDHAHLEFSDDVGIHCDINFSNYVAIHNTTLLRCYCKCDPRVREMGIFVKVWAKARKINTPYHGTLSSYGYVLMVLHYLMNVAKPPVIPNLQHRARDADAWAGKTEVELFEGFDVRFDNDEKRIEHAARAGQMTENKQSLGALLHGFFWYYSDRQGFHWIEEVISIRTVGGILSKQSKGWTEGKWAGEKKEIRLRYLFAIEDPFETEHNIARTVGHSGVVAIRDEFRRAWDIIGKARLGHGGGWQWRKPDGAIGEDLLQKAEDRGDLFKQDQEYHRKKQQFLRAAFAARKEKEDAAKAEGLAPVSEEGGLKEIVANGTSSASMPNPIQTDEGGLSTDPPNSQLIDNSRTQLAPKCTKGRRRRVQKNSDSSRDEVGHTSPDSSFGNGGTLSKSTAEATSVAEYETDIQNPNESDDIADQTADSSCPHVDTKPLNASSPARFEDVSVRPGPVDDGKPLAWNRYTPGGRWLHWRDRKIRRGDWEPQKQSAGASSSPNRLYPYDASRPVSAPSSGAQGRNEWLREKRMAHFTGGFAGPSKSANPSNSGDSPSHDMGHSRHTSDQPSGVAFESPRQDSAISDMTEPGPETPTPPSFKIRRPNKQSSTGKLPVGPGSETPSMTTGKTISVATAEPVSAPIQNGIDVSLRPRDEDPNIMPIPSRTGFKFDPRQLRDLAIIREGGNGCARGGEEWNVEIDGISGDQGAGNDWEYGKGDDQGLLGELPNLGAIEV